MSVEESYDMLMHVEKVGESLAVASKSKFALTNSKVLFVERIIVRPVGDFGLGN